MYHLRDSIKAVKGIGDKKSKQLAKVGIETVEDLLLYFPRSYEDRRLISKLADAVEGQRISAIVEVLERPASRSVGPRKNLTKVLVRDGSEKAYLSWFNRTYISKELSVGDKLKVSGLVSVRGIVKELSNPLYTKDLESDAKIGGIVPIYGLTEGLKNGEIVKYMRELLDKLVEVEVLPTYIRKENGLVSFNRALAELHFPTSREAYKLARDTLSFGELMKLQLGLLYLKSNRGGSSKGISFSSGDMLERLELSLPFKLTGAQTRTISEIERDMESSRQMNRLVQGDVGSGKTVVGAMALLKAVDSGYQGAMMAPTEILAKQHHESLRDMLSKLGVRVELVVSNLGARKKADILDKLRRGELDILVGTHALIEDYVEFKRLGIVITDEQHRFGVNQRAKLSEKGERPDVLVMTATPIPRTLALMLYGDLDVSIIDELPPGRKEIKTYARESNARDRIYEFLERQVDKGRQAYVVCPLIEDSESMDLNSVESVYQELGDKYQDYRVGLLHGRLRSSEKDRIMGQFKNKEIDVLVSTTVIEVGVNVPNANIMIIENAERFGLSQLHQLRGRVGRGSHQSYCILINGGRTSVAKERARVMEETTDGFIISEKDLELRGPGEFFGIRQHGLPELRVAKLPRDTKILLSVQQIALRLIERDPELELEENQLLRAMVELLIGDRVGQSLN